MINFLLIMLLIMPWVFFPSANIVDQFRLPQALVMDVMFLGIIAFSFNAGNRFIYRNKYLACLVGYMFLHFIYYYFIPFSLEFRTGRILNTAALEPITHIILGLFALYIIITSIDRKDLVRISKAICLSGVLVSIFAILQRIGFDPLKSIGKYNCDNIVSACLDNPNVVGNYLVLCLPLYLMFSDIKFKIGMLLVLLGILATSSHFAVILSAIGVVTFLIAKYRKNKWAWLSLGGLIIGSISVILLTDFAKLTSNMSNRLDVWQVGLEKLKVNVIFGQGIGVWKTWTIKIKSTYWLSVHSDWLERTIEMGLIWLGLAIAFVFNSIKNVNLEDELGYCYLSMFVVFLVMMLCSFPFETPTIAVLGLMSFIGVERS